MLAVAFALSASVLWGVADFMAGRVSRTVAVIPLAFASQGVGLVGVLAIWGATTRSLDTAALGLGLCAGLFGGTGIVCFYAAFARGKLSIVAPLVALGALLPFTVSIVRGERPGSVALSGAVVALVGAVLASRTPEEGETDEREHRRGTAIVWALAAAVLLGTYAQFQGLAGQRGDALAALVGGRGASVSVIVVVLAIVGRPASIPRRSWATVVVVGTLEIGANTAFTLASDVGLLSLVAVLSSLYPIVTIALAYGVLHERIAPAQRAGVLLALVGVALVASGA